MIDAVTIPWQSTRVCAASKTFAGLQSHEDSRTVLDEHVVELFDVGVVHPDASPARLLADTRRLERPVNA